MAVEKCNINLGINLGDRFRSFKEVDAKIEQATFQNFLQYYRRDSRTIEASKHKTKRYLNPDLQYYEIKYACIHGGRKYVPRGKGIRNKKTFRNEDICLANIVIRASACGNELEVTKIENEHNHRVDKILFDELPHQRKLPIEIRENAKKLLKIKANKHMLRHQLEQDTQKVIWLKDLSNLQQENKHEYQNSIEAICQTINNKYGADCHLLVEENEFRGLLFATPGMISTMNAYPEMICIDAAYRLPSIKAPVYIMLVEDGCGESEVVAIGILTKEDKTGIKGMLAKLKEIHPKATEIKSVMADKDWIERDVLQECFPDAKILVCIFHVFKIFNRKITGEKLRMTRLQRNLTQSLLQRMVYARNEIEFNKIKLRIENELPKTVTQYLGKNWVDISKEWCPILGSKISNFMNTTSNLIEGINAKLKSVAPLHSSLEKFFENLFQTLKSLKKEKRSRLAHNINKRAIYSFPSESAEHRYLKYVSEYAFKHIVTQLKYIDKVKFELSHNGIFKVAPSSTDASCQTTSDSCDCYFFNSMGLPCKHILSVRQHLNEDLYDEGLVHQRWTLAYILEHQNFCQNLQDRDITEPNINPRVESVSAQTKILSQQEKYKCVMSKAKCIAHLAAESSTSDFKKILAAMDQFVHLLEENKLDIKVTCDELNNDVKREQTVDDDGYNNEYSEGSPATTAEERGDVLQETKEIVIEYNEVGSIYYDTLNSERVLNAEISTDDNILSSSTEDVSNKSSSSQIDLSIESESKSFIPSISNSIITHAQNEENAEKSGNITVPPVFRKRGCPAGSNITVNGLPSKRKRT